MTNKSSWQLSKESYAWIWDNLSVIIKFLIPTSIIIVIGSYIFWNLSNPLIAIIIYLLGLYFVCSSMVQIHRMIVLNESGKKNKLDLFPKPEKSFFIYFGVWCVLNFLNTLSDRIIENSQIPLLISIFIIIAILYIIIRGYLIFPAVAVNKDITHVLNISQNKFWKISLSSLYIILPMFVISFIFIFIFLITLGVLDPIYFNLFGYPLFFILFVLNFIIINIHYSILFLEFENQLKISETKLKN